MTDTRTETVEQRLARLVVDLRAQVQKVEDGTDLVFARALDLARPHMALVGVDEQTAFDALAALKEQLVHMGRDKLRELLEKTYRYGTDRPDIGQQLLASMSTKEQLALVRVTAGHAVATEKRRRQKAGLLWIDALKLCTSAGLRLVIPAILAAL